MTRWRWIALAAALGCGGCKDVSIPDSCGGYFGRTCISLAVLSPGSAITQIDQLSVTVTSGFALDPSPALTPPAPARPFDLPVVVAILPPSTFAGGTFALTVRGLLGGGGVGDGVVNATVVAGQHVRVTVTLRPPSEPFDLGGDLSGSAVDDLSAGGDGGAVADLLGSGGDDGGGDSGAALDMGPLAPPRQLFPLSTGTVTSLRPNFRWVLAPGADGVHVDLCSDRACTGKLTSAFDATGTSGAPSTSLPQKSTVYWRLFSTVSGAIVSGPSPVWQLYTGMLNTTANTAFGTTLDVNGDGFGDLAVGAPGLGTPAPMDMSLRPGQGQVLVYFGSNGTDWRTTAPAVRSTLTEMTPSDGNAFGFSVASAGDVNGDGYADLIVGAPQNSAYNPPNTPGAGFAYVYLGGPNGLGATPAPSSVLALPGGSAKDNFGVSVAAAGDVDGDGYGDVLVGAPGIMTRTGMAFIYRGGPNGLGAAPMPAYTLAGSTTTKSSFGAAVTSAGDVDGDGYSDVLVSAFEENSNDGSVYIYRGGPTGIGTNPTPAFTTRIFLGVGDISFGISVAGAGDVNGDGYSDIAVARRYSDDFGTVYVYLGGPTGIDAAQSPFQLRNPNRTAVLDMTNFDAGTDFFGASMAFVGDVDGDGKTNLVVGAPGAPGQPSNMPGPGRGYLYFAYQVTTPSTATPIVLHRSSEANGNQLGFSIHPMGDIGNDGHADFALGAPLRNGSDGLVAIYLQTSGGFSSNRVADYELPGTASARTNFGY